MNEHWIAVLKERMDPELPQWGGGSPCQIFDGLSSLLSCAGQSAAG